MKNTRVKIHVIGKDDWALGTEYRLACECLGLFAEIVENPDDADFLHTVDVEETASKIYQGAFCPHIPIVGAINNHPTRLIEWPGFVQIANQYMHLVPQSTIAAEDLQRLGLKCVLRSRIATDAESYHHIKDDDNELMVLRKDLGIPEHRYLIGLLQRDSEGRDLRVPKRQKGPDIFLGLMMLLKKRRGPDSFHVLLGGPRRHWIRSAFEREGIPYTFVGKSIEGEDYPDNILDKATMCKLYNLLDLYVIPTRWEGAPRQIFDVLECGRKIISTPVGIAPDILSPECIYHSLPQGVDLIERDMDSGMLNRYIESGKQKVEREHSVKSVGEQWERVYQTLLEHGRKKNVPTPESNTAFKGSRSGVLSNAWSFLNDKTRIGLLRTKLFPHKVGVITDSHKKRAVLTELFNFIEDKGVRQAWNDLDQDTLLIWGMLDDAVNVEGKRIIAVLDEEGCANILLNDRKRFSYFAQVEATIITSDILFARLNQAGLLPRNPVVVRLPPHLSTFKESRNTIGSCCVEKKCVVFSDASSRWCEEWLHEIDSVEGVSVTHIDNAETDWNKKTDQDKVAVLREHEFAVVLSEALGSGMVEELLACGLPCLYPGSRQDIQTVVGMAGLGVESVGECFNSTSLMRDNSECFRAAISLPSLEEAALTIRNMIYTHPNSK